MIILNCVSLIMYFKPEIQFSEFRIFLQAETEFFTKDKKYTIIIIIF